MADYHSRFLENGRCRDTIFMSILFRHFTRQPRTQVLYGFTVLERRNARSTRMLTAPLLTLPFLPSPFSTHFPPLTIGRKQTHQPALRRGLLFMSDGRAPSGAFTRGGVFACGVTCPCSPTRAPAFPPPFLRRPPPRAAAAAAAAPVPRLPGSGPRGALARAGPRLRVPHRAAAPASGGGGRAAGAAHAHRGPAAASAATARAGTAGSRRRGRGRGGTPAAAPAAARGGGRRGGAPRGPPSPAAAPRRGTRWALRRAFNGGDAHLVCCRPPLHLNVSVAPRRLKVLQPTLRLTPNYTQI